MSTDMHTKVCLASAMMSAIENFRDSADVTDVDFRIMAQSNKVLHEADAYLAEGLSTCRCHVAALVQVIDLADSHGIDYGMSLARAHLDNGTITWEQFQTLVVKVYHGK